MQSTLGVIVLNGFYIIKRLAVANQYENTNMGNLVWLGLPKTAGLKILTKYVEDSVSSHPIKTQNTSLVWKKQPFKRMVENR